MRPALLTPVYFPEVRRGTERVVREVAARLRATGHRPRIVTSHPGRLRRSTEDGVEVVRLPRPRGAGRLRARAFPDHLTHVPLAYAALRAGDDDLAHAFYATDAVAAARWGRRSGRPSVLSWNGVPRRELLAARRGSTRLLEASVLAVDAVVVPSAAAARAMERWLGVAARVIHPGVDLAAFAPAADPAAARADEPTIVCAADAGDPRKRVGLLVEALALVRRARPGTRLVLVRPRDPALARDLAAAEGVRLAEPVDDPAALAALYRSAWVSALAAYNEAFGLVLAEALACGTPVVGFADGGIPEVLGDAPVGRLFGEPEPRAVAAALLGALELAEDGATAAACRARAAAFAAEAAGDRHAALYAELLAR